MSDENNFAKRGGAGEPSMDEILASIRRILKEDEKEDEREPGTENEAAASAEDSEDEIFVLSAEMEAKPVDISAATAPAAPATPPAPEPGAAMAPQIPPEATPQNGTEMEPAMDDDEQSPAGLVSEAVTAEIASALGPLVRSMGVERSLPVSRGGLSLEEIVREEVRPMLKSWLDSHLPSLVQRIVRAEIERVIHPTRAG
jgi:hypothetical protein